MATVQPKSAARIFSEYSAKRKPLSMANDAKTLNKVHSFVSTGVLPLDIIMGGGVPIGRMIEIYGDNSTGKSLVGEHILAETQKMGGTAVMIDTEVTASDEIMTAVGINVDDLLYAAPETIEDLWDIIMGAVDAKQKADPNGIMTILWDSVAATSSQEELDKLKEKGLSSYTIGLHARKLSTMFRVLPNLIARSNIALVLINQTRENIGVMFGEQKSTFGGRAVGYYASVRLELSTIGKIKTGLTISGIEVKALVSKNKIAAPFGKCELPILFGHGVDEAGAIFAWLKLAGVITSKGSWWTLAIPGCEARFQRVDWPATLLKNDNLIRQYMLSNAGFAFEMEEEKADDDEQ